MTAVSFGREEAGREGGRGEVRGKKRRSTLSMSCSGSRASKSAIPKKKARKKKKRARRKKTCRGPRVEGRGSRAPLLLPALAGEGPCSLSCLKWTVVSRARVGCFVSLARSPIPYIHALCTDSRDHQRDWRLGTNQCHSGWLDGNGRE